MSATPIALPAPSEDFADRAAAAPLFQDLPAQVVKAICDHADYRRYATGQTVCSQGQFDGDEFFVVLSGRLRVSTMDADSGAMWIEEVGPGELFALEFAMVENPEPLLTSLSVTAEEDTAALAVDAQYFRTLAAQRPTVMRNVAGALANALRGQRFKSTVPEPAPQTRIFAALLKFAARGGLAGEWRIERMPKHRELAEAADVDEAAAAGAVAELIQEGVARREYPGLVICDYDRLTKLAGNG